MIVYLITNLINGKQYIGRQRKYSSEYLGSGRLIIEAIKEFGKRNFEKEILIDDKYIDNWEECAEFEATCKLSFNTLFPNGYNKTLWEYPIPVETCKEGGRKSFKEKRGMFDPANKERAKEGSRKGGRISGEKQAELEIGMFALFRTERQNKLCRRCICECKQSDEVEIIICPQFKMKNNKVRKEAK